jgi:hypothetical protein
MRKDSVDDTISYSYLIPWIFSWNRRRGKIPDRLQFELRPRGSYVLRMGPWMWVAPAAQRRGWHTTDDNRWTEVAGHDTVIMRQGGRGGVVP